MATPSSSPPLESAPSSSMLKRTRKATQLRSLSTRPMGVERPLVHMDPTTWKANGPHKKKLRAAYLGVISRDKMNITYVNWKQVPIAQKDLIWEDIQLFQLNLVCYCNWLY